MKSALAAILISYFNLSTVLLRTPSGHAASTISGHPDIRCLLLHDDSANELFLSVGLGTHRILTRVVGS